MCEQAVNPLVFETLSVYFVEYKQNEINKIQTWSDVSGKRFFVASLVKWVWLTVKIYPFVPCLHAYQCPCLFWWYIQKSSCLSYLECFYCHGNVSSSNEVVPCLKTVRKKNYFIVQDDVQHLPKSGCWSKFQVFRIPVWIDNTGLCSVTANLGVFVLTSYYRGLVGALSESTVFCVSVLEQIAFSELLNTLWFFSHFFPTSASSSCLFVCYS